MSAELRFATIGTSAICERFIDAVERTDGVQYVASYSRSLAKAHEFADKHHARLAFDNLDTLAGSSAVDAVYIASPNALHAPQAKKMLSAGKHVLVEKSFASNTAEAASVFACADENGAVAMEAMRNLYDPGFEETEHVMAQLGTVHAANLRFSKITSRMARLRAGNRINVFDPRLSEGALMDIGVYAVEPAVALFGVPERIAAAGVMGNVPEEPADSPYRLVDLSGEILLEYSEMVASIGYGKTYDSLIPCEIAGDLGTLSIRSIANFSGLGLSMHEDKGMIYDTGKGSETNLHVDTPHNDMVCELACFLKATGGDEEARSRIARFRQVTLDSLAVMDEARSQLNVHFPSDMAAQFK